MVVLGIVLFVSIISATPVVPPLIPNKTMSDSSSTGRLCLHIKIVMNDVTMIMVHQQSCILE